MQHELLADFSASLRFANSAEAGHAKHLFCERFRSALQECVRHRFSVEESFGMIWIETLDVVPLLPHEQAQVYDSLIQWAKSCFVSEIFAETVVEQVYA